MFKGSTAFEEMAKIANQRLGDDDKIDIDEIMSREVNGLIDFGVWRETVSIKLK